MKFHKLLMTFHHNSERSISPLIYQVEGECPTKAQFKHIFRSILESTDYHYHILEAEDYDDWFEERHATFQNWLYGTNNIELDISLPKDGCDEYDTLHLYNMKQGDKGISRNIVINNTNGDKHTAMWLDVYDITDDILKGTEHLLNTMTPDEIAILATMRNRGDTIKSP